MKIGVILVTFNRLDKLKVALDCYNKQSYQPEYICVINNCSTDGTDRYLEDWEKQLCNYEKKVINLPYNSGGAGGFYAGLKQGMNLDAEWLWVADDDAYPEEDAFERINEFYENRDGKQKQEIVAMCSSVINNGEIHYAHRNRVKLTKLKCKFQPSTERDYEKAFFEIDVFSYVGTMIRKDILKKAGLPEKEFFIYCDDQEHALRVRKYGKIICIPSSKVIHNTPGFDDKGVFWGTYYNARNNIIMLKKHFPKRYYFLKMTKAYWVKASIFSKNLKPVRKLFAAAYRDAFRNKIGIHEIYKPGWKL